MIETVTDPAIPELKLFLGCVPDYQSGRLMHQQLPFLKNLCRKVESLTGWQIDYAESVKSHQARQNRSATTVLGTLAIEDMSFDLPAEQSPLPRNDVDGLVATLDQMIQVIQEDHAMLEGFSSRVTRVVKIPFEQWSLQGHCGCQRGNIVSWAIGSDEKIYFLSGKFDHALALELAGAARSIEAVFKAAVSAGCSLKLLQEMLEIHVDDSQAEAQLLGLTVIELEPVVGQYQICQLGAISYAFLGDIESSCFTPIYSDDGIDYLFPKQVLVLGDPNEKVLSGWLGGFDDFKWSPSGFTKSLGQGSESSPCIGFFRK